MHPCPGPQMIYDLLVKNSPPLELREDPQQGVQVAGLKHINVMSAAEIMVRRGRRLRLVCVRSRVQEFSAVHT